MATSKEEVQIEFKEGLTGAMRWVATSEYLPIYAEGLTANEAASKFQDRMIEYFRLVGRPITIIERPLY